VKNIARLAVRGMMITLALLALAAGQSIVVQPPLHTFVMRSGLAGAHPRLYFTQADIPTIKQRALGPCSWFYKKAKSDFGGYVSQRTPDAPGTWKDYLFGFWGQFSMCMFYLVEGDTAYANAARSWALFYAGRSDWLADDLVPMDITSGMALTYDILYDYLSATDRATLRTALKRSIDTIQPRFAVGQYWTEDYQNNHMHNRIHGLANASFAIYGDDAAIDVQTAADLAVGCFTQVAAWLPDDGSTHEGAGYWDYGYPWVARDAALINHVTGIDLTAGKPHFSNDYLYRLYMTTPGWNNMFNIGDADEGPPSNAEAWLPGIARNRDAAADSVIRRLMKEQSGGFYQQTMWGVLWYPDSLQPQPYSSLPLYRFWPDLEMFSIRGSWADTATAFVFKCGPPGGNHMQQLRNGNYVNVAHDHPDQNHFLLFSGGRMLAQDDGYPEDNKVTRSHNTIVIDTLGQTNEGGQWYQPFDYGLCGHLTDVMLSGSSACASGDATKLYKGASKFARHIAFVEGGYVISIDDLKGTGTTTHAFNWRLHKTGTWSSGQAGEFIVADSSNMRLDIRFLEPPVAGLQSAFLPVDPVVATSHPCLSVTTRASSAHFTAVVVPQHNSQPALASTLLSATGGTAVQVQGGATTDMFAMRSDSANLTVGNIQSDATNLLVRTQNAATSFAMMTRGTVVTIAGATLVRSVLSANLAWRIGAQSVTVEAEPPYTAAGGADTIIAGGLIAGSQYTATVDSAAPAVLTAAGDGTVRVPVNLVKRLVITLVKGMGIGAGNYTKAFQRILIRPLGNGVIFIIPATGTMGSSIAIYSQQGRPIWQWEARNCSVEQRVLWMGIGKNGRESPAGVYCAKVKIGNAGRTATFALVR
jgi:Heparinase II/III-like protein/Domain of unknown function (DUF4962)